MKISMGKEIDDYQLCVHFNSFTQRMYEINKLLMIFTTLFGSSVIGNTDLSTPS
jgi:hypothetical protein